MYGRWLLRLFGIIEMNNWGVSQPWFENKNFLSFLLDKANLVDIISRYELEYSVSPTGNFTHKMKCPLLVHLKGGERTASFYFNNTSWHCFGCSGGNNVIDFICQYKGMPYYKAVEMLAKIYGLVDIDESELDQIVVAEKTPIEHTITPYIYHTGLIIREHLKNVANGTRGKWLRWAQKEFQRLDYYIENYSDNDWKKIKKNQDRIIGLIQRKEIK
jgi:hypothetical protein